MGFFSSFASAFMDGLRSGQQSAPPPEPAEPPPRLVSPASGSAFENRLLRARTEPLKIVRQRFTGMELTAADIHNEQSGGTYRVTSRSCTCEDYQKTGQPCKHMIFFSLRTGSFPRYERPWPPEPPKRTADGFVPYYPRYYSGPPTGIGYMNLYPYFVVGRVHGVSEKTGRPTDRKKEIVVSARSEEDAQAAASSLGVVPPYVEVSRRDISPSYNQLSYLHAVHIPFPYFVTADDVAALLTRHQQEDDAVCPDRLFDMATRRRVGVSYFASPQMVINTIWYLSPPEERPGLFCYAAYCRETGREIGCAPLPETDDAFTSFAPSQKQQLAYIKDFRPSFPIRSMSRQSKAYSAALFHIRRCKPWILPPP